MKGRSNNHTIVMFHFWSNRHSLSTFATCNTYKYRGENVE